MGARQAEGRFGHECGSEIEIGIGENDGWVFTAHFHLSSGHALSQLEINLLAHGMRTGEGQRHNGRMRSEFSAHLTSVAYDDVHWFWTDQYEHELQVAGVAGAWDELVVRGSLEERTFVAFYLQRGIVRAVAGLDRAKDVRRARPLIRAGRRVDQEALRDEDVDLRRLAPAAEGGRMTGTDG